MRCCRWLVKRIPHMTRIRCDGDTDEAAYVLRGLLPCFSGLIAPATKLIILLDACVLPCSVPPHTCYTHQSPCLGDP